MATQWGVHAHERIGFDSPCRGPEDPAGPLFIVTAGLRKQTTLRCDDVGAETEGVAVDPPQP
jgi:hypothetical protein